MNSQHADIISKKKFHLFGYKLFYLKIEYSKNIMTIIPKKAGYRNLDQVKLLIL